MIPPLEHQIHHFLTEETQTEKGALFLAQEVLKQGGSPEEKRHLFTFLRGELRTHPSPLLTEALVSLSKNWKQDLLGARIETLFKVKCPFFSYNNASDQPLDIPSRFSFQSTAEGGAVFGSTFLTNKPHRLDRKGHHILDGAYGVRCTDEKGAFSGFALALGDGAGGHFGDTFQDERIGRSSYFGAKWSTYFLSSYSAPETLKENLPTVLNLLKQEVSFQGQGEGTTLVACRIFVENEGFRLMGINIGDSLLCAWNPHTCQFYPLLPAVVSEAGTAIFPEAYRSFEVNTVDEYLPKETLVFLLSDGIHDLLPFTEEEGAYPNGLTYRRRTLSPTLFKDLPPETHLPLYFQKLMQCALEKIETLRQNQVGEVQLGDDLTLVGCRLTEPSLFDHLTHKIQTFFGAYDRALLPHPLSRPL